MNDQNGGSPEHAVGEISVAPPTDWLEARPTLRDDLIFRPQKIAGRAVYVIEDTSRSKFYRLGAAEYRIAASFDGRTTIRRIVEQAVEAPLEGEEPISEQEAVTIFQWAAQNELLETAPATTARVASSSQNTAGESRSKAAAFNPLLLKIPLIHPDPLLARVYPYLSWIYSRPMTIVGLLLVAAGLFRLITHWDSFLASTAGIFSPTGQVSLLACWVGLKCIHELSHGLVCRRYGGNVRDGGVVLILFVPIAYVDVTSSWRLRSKWKRLHISAAGMQLELYIAAAAALVWSWTETGVVHQAAANVVLMAGITTILFNANPLMRFDGYYILTDLLELPNLAATAQQWLRGRAREFFYGIPAPATCWPNGRPNLIRIYAVLAFGWRIFVCAGLIAAAAVLWHGAGILLALSATVVWVLMPLWRIMRTVWGRQTQPAVDRRRFLIATCGTGAAVAVLLTAVDWPGATRAPGIVQYAPLTRVRTISPGFVDEVFVTSGQQVQAGQMIARLSNDQLQRDHAIQRLKIDASLIRIRRLKQRRELAALKAEREQLVALREQMAELEEQVDGLTVEAPCGGRVVSRNVGVLEGTYLDRGGQLLAIGDDRRKQIQFLVSDARRPDFQAVVGMPLAILVQGSGRTRGRLERIDPRGSRVLLDDSLAVVHGGSLTVRPASRSASHPGESRWELLAPHFTGTVSLAETSGHFVAGQRTWVSLIGERESLGGRLAGIISAWLDRQSGNAS